MLLDAEVFGDELAGLIRDYVAEAARPLLDKIKELEQIITSTPIPKDGKDAAPVDYEMLGQWVTSAVVTEVQKWPAPKNGKDADPELVHQAVFKAMESVPKPKDGQSVDMGAVFTEIGTAVTRAVEALPKPKDGKDGVDGKDGRDGIDGKNGIDGKAGADGINAKDGAPGTNGRNGVDGKDGKDGISGKDGVDGINGKDGAVGISGKDGKSVDAGEVVQLIAKAIEVLPKPRDGRDGIDADMEALIEVARSAAVAEAAKIPAPMDGKDGSSVTLDDVLPKLLQVSQSIIEDLVVRHVALIPKAQDGKDVDPFYVAGLVRSEVDRAVSALPPARDGKDGEPGTNGAPGKDGFAIDDFEFGIEDDGRTVALALRSGNREEVRKAKLACPIDRGVHRPGVKYEKGDVVTHSGSLWIAQKDTSTAPGNGPSDWRLAVKRAVAIEKDA